MITNNTIEKDGVTFNKVAVNLAVSAIFLNGQINGAVSLRCIPYEDETKTPLIGEDRTLFIPNVYESADPDVIEASIAIQTALQKLIIAKNL